jgi:hypothetical protein
MQTELGPCAQFSIYHLMELENGEERLRSDEAPNGLFIHEIAVFQAPVTSSSVDAAQSLEANANIDVQEETEPGAPKKDTNGTDLASNSGPKAHSPPKTLGDISTLLRSKNAGPYEITLDVMFESPASYQLVKAASFLNASSMAKLFGVQEEDIVWQGFFDQALAYKVTIPRLRNGKPTSSGGYMESDVHASQMYIGFMNLKLPEGLVERWGCMKR